jgi:acyl-coenzyme A thioesterase PaaI-like protein
MVSWDRRLASPRSYAGGLPDVHEVFPDHRLEARTNAAGALRQLSEALVAHDADDIALDEVAIWAMDMGDRIRRGARLERAADYQRRRYLDPPPPDGQPLITSSDRPISGPANPSAISMTVRRVGAEALAQVVFDRRFESSPGRVHGGITASVFDDVMGYVQVIDGVAAYTADLYVRYLAAMPLYTPIEIRARTTERNDRRSVVTAEARIAGTDGVLADARAVFALIPLDRLDPPNDSV